MMTGMIADGISPSSIAYLIIFTGCGSGKYLSVNPLLYNLGSDRCGALTEIARQKEHEVIYTISPLYASVFIFVFTFFVFFSLSFSLFPFSLLHSFSLILSDSFQ